MARKKTDNPDNPGGLTYKQRLFVSYYLGKANGNATESARMAGYAQPHSQGPRLLENVGIRAAIESRVAEAGLAADEVLARLAEHATADMGDFITIGKGGAIGLDLEAARAADRLRLIKKITPNQFGYALELYDAQAALDKLARYHGLYKDGGVAPGNEAVRLIRERLSGGRSTEADGRGAG